MPLRLTFAACAAVLSLAAPALADAITIKDPFARASSPSAKSGAAFMQIANSGETEDRLVAARSDVAQRVEIHTHIQDANGVMRMVEIEDGIVIPAGGMAMLQRGGDHVMFLGLIESLDHGETISVTLTFEQAGDIEVPIPVDLERMPGAGAHGGHGMKTN